MEEQSGDVDFARIRILARVDARTEIRGQLLSTCVSCHATSRDH